MAKFLIGVLTGVFICAIIAVIVVFSVLRFREKPPEVADNSVLVLQLDGDVPERAPVELPINLFGLGERGQPTVENVWMMLRKAAADGRIKAVALEPQGLHIGWAKLEEIRADLAQFKKSGKPLYAYLKTPSAREYYLATAADRIYMGPEDQLYLKGMRMEAMYFKGTLDKLGVGVQIEHAGKYKDFGDMFTRTSMSPETREVLTSMLDDLYGNLVTRIAQARRKTPQEVDAIINTGPFLATQAQAAGLVDSLRFEDQMYGELDKRIGTNNAKRVSTATYLRIPGASLGLTGPHRIAYLVAQGDITRGDPSDTGSGESGITSEGFSKLVRQVRGDSGIEGVVVRIDSPGGEVVASDVIWRELNLLRQKKPVVFSMSDTAASGGYYIALTGDPIIAYAGTMTGSIGVVFGKPDLKGLYNKVGITKDMVAKGRFAAIDSDYTELGPAELEKLRQGIDASYRSFVGKVAEARRRPYAQIEPVAQGRVWLGSQAQPRGLVDQLGGIDQAVALIKQKAKIPASDKVTLVVYPARRSLWDVLFSRGGEEAILEARAPMLLREWQARARMSGMLRIMPFLLQAE